MNNLIIGNNAVLPSADLGELRGKNRPCMVIPIKGLGESTLNDSFRIELSERTDLLELVEDGIITPDAAREVIMREKRRKEEKQRDDIQLKYSMVHSSPITYNEKDGRWWTRVPDENGKLVQRPRKTLDGIEKMLRLVYFGDETIESDRELATLATLFPLWVDAKKRDREDPTSASTIERYESDWKNRIKPEQCIVNIPIKSLSEEMLKEWSDRLFDEVSESYYTNIKTVIYGVLEYAVQNGIITREENPSPGMLKKRAKKRKAIKAAESGLGEEKKNESFTPEETVKLEEAALDIARKNRNISNPAIFYGIAFWIHTGLRPSELLALKHKDLNDGILTVCRMYTYHEDERSEDGKRTKAKIKPWLKSYKTKRTFAVDQEAIAIMQECVEQKTKRRFKTEYAFSVSDLPTTHNKLMKAVKKVCRQAGVDYKRPYTFRDTWITALLDSGKFTVAEIADMAGNSPKVIFENYYGNRRKVTTDTNYMSEALKGLKG